MTQKETHRDVIVVSGLPRSGTSMVMQMLRAGGVEVLSDQMRTPDENNPNGYLEDQRTKKLHLDNAWMNDACGKAIKVVAPLLQFLPTQLNYQIIFIERDIREVIASQNKMLGKDNTIAGNAILTAAFLKQIEKAKHWICNNVDAKVLYLKYAETICNPKHTSEQIARFLGGQVNSERMLEAVSPELYRNKSNL